MRKLFCLIVLFLFFANAASQVYADVLEAGIKYDVKAAREYLQDGQVDSINITGPFEFVAQNIKQVVYSYNNSGDVIGITVEYINEPNRAYIYDRNKRLIYVDKYDKPVNIYPHRGYRYNLDGKLDLTSLSVSKNEQFRFSPDGRLIAHAKNGVIYDENGNVIGKAK